MKPFRKYISTVIILFATFLTCGQDSKPIKTLIGGKWSVCTSTKFSKDFQCLDGYTSYEFFEDGSYKEHRQPVCKGKKMEYVLGKWRMTKKTLIMEENMDNCYNRGPSTYKILWLNDNTFYKSGKEGVRGPTIYTYFQRR